MLNTALGVSFIRVPVLAMTLQGRGFILIFQMRKHKSINGLIYFPRKWQRQRQDSNPNNSNSKAVLFNKIFHENGNVLYLH